MKKYGLIGKKLGHSFSQAYFSKKFIDDKISDSTYNLYELETIRQLLDLVQSNPEIVGLNVTVPYKESVIPLLDSLSPEAKKIGAVNTIVREKNGNLHGYNTDVSGFKTMLNNHLPIIQTNAMVLGTGGSSRAVCYVLEQLNIKVTRVSRNNSANTISYEQLRKEHYDTHGIIINTTPLGMFPDVDSAPQIDYHCLTPRHVLFDLVYNPAITRFLAQGKCHGAIGINGLEMLYAQAEASWLIWKESLEVER